MILRMIVKNVRRLNLIKTGDKVELSNNHLRMYKLDIYTSDKRTFV